MSVESYMVIVTCKNPHTTAPCVKKVEVVEIVAPTCPFRRLPSPDHLKRRSCPRAEVDNIGLLNQNRCGLKIVADSDQATLQIHLNRPARAEDNSRRAVRFEDGSVVKAMIFRTCAHGG
jgi:hypothetical protein